MSQSLQIFEEKKERVIKQLMRLDDLAEEMNLPHSSKQVTDAILTLHREQFELIVVGEFSNGKSTFVNALLGKEILPSSVKPTTAILNKIYYNDEPKFRLHYRNPKLAPKVVNEELFKKIVAPGEPTEGDENGLLYIKRSIELIKSIDHAEIGYPLPLCRNNIVIIDSPGTNDLDPAREAITNHYIPKSDAAIIVLNATRALSASELSFLRDRILSSDIDKIFFVINFLDYLRTEEDVQKVYHYVKNELNEIVKEPKIFFVSSRHALLQRRLASGDVLPKQRRPLLPLEKTGFQAFESALLDFLQYERGAAKLEKPIKSGLKISKEILEKHIPFERMSLNNNISDLQEQTKQLNDQLEHTRHIGKNTAHSIRMKMIQEGSNIKRWYEQELRKIADKADVTLQTHYYKGCHVDSVRREIELATAPLEKDLHESFKNKIETQISTIITVESRELENAFTMFDDQFSSMLTADSGEYTAGQLMNLISSHGGKITGLFIASTIISTFWLLPGALLLGGLIVVGGFILDGINAFASIFNGRDHVEEKLKREVDRRFREPISEKTKQFEREWSNVSLKVVEQYEEIVKQQIQEKENQLDILIKNNQMSTLEIEELMAKLSQRENKVKEIIVELENSFLREKVGV
ncbi:dynamin family protein [Peribacillus acanthi]|uniref:dynamin family protein n=1 Tax=Peribacillus acanthi TaxID=2171554 RepID=UPI000D3EB17A|nr:dynamin family protein [Peribacillus acanthi]